jgi:hypothetical protein
MGRRDGVKVLQKKAVKMIGREKKPQGLKPNPSILGVCGTTEVVP